MARRRETIALKGLRELQRDLAKVARGARRELDSGLKRAAEPVVEQSRANLRRFAGAKLNTIRPKVRVGRVTVEQSARKVTGKRPDWGATQMRYGLIPALQERQGEVLDAIEDELDRFTSAHGLPMRRGVV